MFIESVVYKRKQTHTHTHTWLSFDCFAHNSPSLLLPSLYLSTESEVIRVLTCAPLLLCTVQFNADAPSASTANFPSTFPGIYFSFTSVSPPPLHSCFQKGCRGCFVQVWSTRRCHSANINDGADHFCLFFSPHFLSSSSSHIFPALASLKKKIGQLKILKNQKRNRFHCCIVAWRQ